MKCYLREKENGEISLIQEVDGLDEPCEIETLPIHKSIWSEYHMNQLLEEEIHFRLSEDMIEEDIFQLVAYPIVHGK